MEALDRINDYKINSVTQDHLDYTLRDYKDLIKSLFELNEKERNAFLVTLKLNEICNNQEMEYEDPFLVKLNLYDFVSRGKRTTIDIMVNMVLNGEPITTRRLEEIHRLIIKNTSDDKEKNYKIRDFDTYVYEIINGVEKVSYIPPEPSEIKKYLRRLYSFLHEDKINKEIDVFYKPILEHFYIAALQPFGNGNTRLARLLEYVGIFKLTRDVLDLKLESPTLYMSHNHFLSRKQYRDSICDTVLNPDDDHMNKWINYNLNMVDEQINYCKSCLKKM